MDEKTYEQGLVQGQLVALEKVTSNHDRRLDGHERRITASERIQFGLLGAIVLLEVLPTIRTIVGSP